MNYLALAFVLTTLVGCRREQTTPEGADQMKIETQIQCHYYAPEGYPKILARLVYAKAVKEGDPFAMDPDESYPGLINGNHPLRSLQDLGFTFLQGNHLSYNSLTQELLVVANPKTHEELVKFHANLGIRIVSVEQAGTGQPATRSQSKPDGGDKPQTEAEGRSR
jgi:hypothetical protein